MRRTQLYLDEDQYRWLKQQAGAKGSIAAVVRELIDRARTRRRDLRRDPLVRYLLDTPTEGRRRSSVATLDEDLYGG
ncbi:MAG TPA: hypothetical protein VNO17_09635 [Actinomycetota bacterium]|nr:hypothetical protein [Actinomycetota bacterium]